ncbi:hypothetical protein FRC09_015468 [Ceratobasidium sp. 395]|nr:hypothetical protein FRC09_015468 [Ceratobasidium sp. 395]
MPASKFRPQEVEFLRTFLPEWKALKTEANADKHKPGETSARNQLLRRVVEDFYERFPERDSTQTDETPETYTADQRAYFPMTGGKEKIRLQKEKTKITARMLIAKHYKDDINPIAQGIRAEKPSLTRLEAFGEATSAFIAQMKKESTSEYERFEDLAEKIRNGALIDYSDQDADALAEMLEMFPKKLHAQVVAWGKSMPVHLYCMAVFAKPPDTTLGTYLALSNSMQAIEGSDAGEAIRELLKWQGGSGPVPWKKLQSDTQHEYIERLRMPTDISIMKDPHDTGRDTLLTWYKHIVAGQQNMLADSHVFQFSRVDRGATSSPLLFTSLLKAQAEDSTLRYAPEEKLYALKVSRGYEGPLSSPTWHGLPLARTVDCYRAFDEPLQAALRSISTEQNKIETLMVLLQSMEDYGPIHASMLDLLDKTLLPSQVFDSTHPDHDFPFRHAPSSTWRGGLQGSRWILFVIARFWITLSVVRDPSSAPSALMRSIEAPSLLRMEQQLCHFSNWYIVSLREATRVLMSTHKQQSKAFDQEVVTRHLKAQITTSPHFQPSCAPSTHGVPEDPSVLASMYHRLSKSHPDETLGAANDPEEQLAPTVASRRARRPTQHMRRVVSDSESDSDSSFSSSPPLRPVRQPSPEGEYIDIGGDDLDSSDEETMITDINIQSYLEGNQQTESVPATEPTDMKQDSSLGDTTLAADTALTLDKTEKNSPDLQVSDEERKPLEPFVPILPADLTAPSNNAAFAIHLVSNQGSAQPALDPPTTLRHTERRLVRRAEAQAAIDQVHPRKKGGGS